MLSGHNTFSADSERTKRMNLKPYLLIVIAGLLLSPAMAQFSNDLEIDFQGAGWYQFGSIMRVSDTITGNANYAGNWIQNYGALFNGIISFNKELQGSFGIGGIKGHTARGSLGTQDGLRYFQTTFVNMARITYTLGGEEYSSPLQITSGLFSYKYDNNIRNLGLYLIRGSVYPQIVISEFESKEMLPIGNLLGVHMRNRFSSFTQDVLLVSEIDLKPRYDYSLIYIANLEVGHFLEIGAGVNFYHLLPTRPSLTKPSDKGELGADWDETESTYDHELDRQFALDLDTAIIPLAQRSIPNDSLSIHREWYSTAGTKVMVRFAFDPKPFFSTDILGANDFKIYGEMAVLGVKNYKKIYNKISERIPVMLGINLPGFKILDDFTFEVEYFGNKHIPDMGKLMDYGSPIARSPYWQRGDIYLEDGTIVKPEPYDVDKDNWKWSLYLAKVISGHVKISGQVASDHFRVGMGAPYPWSTYGETFSSWKDWYWMLKSTFFF